MRPLLALLLCVGTAAAQEPAPKGFVVNDTGQKCAFTQKLIAKSKHFTTTLTADVRVLTFTDQECMKDSGVGLSVNKMMIGNIITRSYSHDDAAFQTREEELKPRSMFQITGRCIQSATYPNIGVMVDFETKRNSIIKVYHTMAAGGCG